MAGLRIAKRRTFWWKVTARVPTDDGHQEFEFRAHFEALSEDAIEAVGNQNRGVRETMREHLLGWEQIYDESGQPLEYSPETLELVLNDRPVLEALTAALWEACVHQGAARKN